MRRVDAKARRSRSKETSRQIKVSTVLYSRAIGAKLHTFHGKIQFTVAVDATRGRRERRARLASRRVEGRGMLASEIEWRVTRRADRGRRTARVRGQIKGLLLKGILVGARWRGDGTPL